jgi:hypothetical protein
VRKAWWAGEKVKVIFEERGEKRGDTPAVFVKADSKGISGVTVTAVIRGCRK